MQLDDYTEDESSSWSDDWSSGTEKVTFAAATVTLADLASQSTGSSAPVQGVGVLEHTDVEVDETEEGLLTTGLRRATRCAFSVVFVGVLISSHKFESIIASKQNKTKSAIINITLRCALRR